MAQKIQHPVFSFDHDMEFDVDLTPKKMKSGEWNTRAYSENERKRQNIDWWKNDWSGKVSNNEEQHRHKCIACYWEIAPFSHSHNRFTLLVFSLSGKKKIKCLYTLWRCHTAEWLTPTSDWSERACVRCACVRMNRFALFLSVDFIRFAFEVQIPFCV